jgi:hypothetical protein
LLRTVATATQAVQLAKAQGAPPSQLAALQSQLATATRAAQVKAASGIIAASVASEDAHRAYLETKHA